ncbi:probable LRR receptor-like serine/threonine-protein kinase At4g37250 [Miscanthus floridulus]|uniref:probable LRR receptor-like serine/threonine-protein kinase At4g37250 n=1 Tax=Miscanthus floridulus TaxID=154761 RepID=UPI00345959F1
MDGRRRGGGRATAGAVGWLLLLLLLASLCAHSRGLNADGVLLMAFKNAVTADPLGALASWTYNDAAPCAWNGFPQPNTGPAAVNVTSASVDGNGNGNSTPTPALNAAAAAAAGELGASLAAATMSRVISLMLPNMQLSGTLPLDLGRVEHLRHLDLFGNSLSGGLPATLLNTTELRVLSLTGNAISSELPNTGAAAYARGLQELNLSGNALVDRLPAALCRLPYRVVLGLASNRFAGELPIGGLGMLELVDLSGNGFNSSLPSDLGGARLRLLNVSSNKLAGAVPTELAALVLANATVDLSRNNFTGVIPQDAPFAAQPAAAYEGNPNLCRLPLKQACSIPSSLSNPLNATDSPPAFAAIPKNPARAPPGAPRQPRPSISRTRGS